MRSMLRFLFFVLFMVAQDVGAENLPSNSDATINAEFVRMQGGTTVMVKPFGAAAPIALSAGDNTALDILLNSDPSDRLVLVVDNAQAPKTIKNVASLQRHHGFFAVLGHVILAAISLLAFGLLATNGALRKLIIGGDGRYSTSKFQMAAWFFTLFTVYLASIFMLLHDGWLGYLGKIEIPQNLVILSGLSALTFGAAKAITVSKVEDAKANSPANLAATATTADLALAAKASLNQPGGPTPAQQIAADKVYALKINNTGPARLRDLVSDDKGCVDIGDSQALFITLLAVILYLISGFVSLSWMTIGAAISLPDVDTALLSIFGVGQGAYLAKKAASTAGNG